MKQLLKLLFLPLVFHFLSTSPIYAIVDPFAAPNNKFGIHIIQATPNESSPAATLVNSTGGDWGYITVLIESKDRNHDKWQEFFNDLRRRHLIPLVRIATQPEGNYWKRPYEGEEQAWADFLDDLNWPTKNRYIIVYNEPNHAAEWGGQVDARLYAETLDKTITALKNKNRDFFVLNGGFDASAPYQPPNYLDELTFMQQMNDAVPGIFEKLDGWVSHSYPNPEFVGSPDAYGRGTVRTYLWEAQQLKNLGVIKDLPVFITETGWKHAEGINFNPRFPKADTLSDYYKNAFENAWGANNIVAVTPFLLSYQEFPFDHFSFKKITGEGQKEKLPEVPSVLGAQFPDYYTFYQQIQNLSKTAGKPIQETLAKLTKGEVYTSIVAGETYDISLTFKNTGQSIWNDSEQIVLSTTSGGKELGLETVSLPKETKIEPGKEHTFNLKVKAPQSGTYQVSLNLFTGNKQFDSNPVQFTTEVKSPVILKIKSGLFWKKEAGGSYLLKITGPTGDGTQTVDLNKEGVSEEIEARNLLPDYPFVFSLEKPYYLPSKIKQTLKTGVNTLDFGILKPDILSAIFNPLKLWQFLPN